jgi:hypothetical protein
MEILYFSSGILTVVLVYMVVSVFKLNKKVNLLEESEDFAKIEYNNIYRTIEINDDKITREIENIYRTIDSRVDKLDNRLSNVVEEHKRQTNIEYNEIYREMDVRINHHATQPIKEISENIVREIDHLQRTIDSRVDKLETRLTKNS